MPQTQQTQGIHKDKKSTDDEETSQIAGQITRLQAPLAATIHAGRDPSSTVQGS